MNNDPLTLPLTDAMPVPTTGTENTSNGSFSEPVKPDTCPVIAKEVVNDNDSLPAGNVGATNGAVVKFNSPRRNVAGNEVPSTIWVVG